MLRFVWIILISIHLIILTFIRLFRVQKECYTEEDRYREASRVVRYVMRQGRISTKVFGTENLPDKGYIMYSNHQGKFDALGIMYGHENPMSVLMDYGRSKVILANKFIDTIKGKRIKKNDPKQQIKVLNELAEEVKEGRRYLIFPEGRYSDNHNTLQEFATGCFRCAVKAKCPIVPVCIIDSWKPFGINSIKPVTTYVHFLRPIEYNMYEGLRPTEIAEMVKNRIQEKINELIAEY